MPVGQKTMNGRITYTDTTYNGTIIDGVFKDGTGILTDGKFGPRNSKEEKGKGWVGWSTDSTQAEYIDITFEFSGLRKFNNANLTINVDKNRTNRVFNKSQIFFSSTKETFSNTSFLQYCPKSYPFKENPYIANVTLPLCENTASFIKLRLYFGGKWLLISEVEFDSGRLSYFLI